MPEISENSITDQDPEVNSGRDFPAYLAFTYASGVKNSMMGLTHDNWDPVAPPSGMSRSTRFRVGAVTILFAREDVGTGGDLHSRLGPLHARGRSTSLSVPNLP